MDAKRRGLCCLYPLVAGEELPVFLVFRGQVTVDCTLLAAPPLTMMEPGLFGYISLDEDDGASESSWSDGIPSRPVSSAPDSQRGVEVVFGQLQA